MAHQAQLIAVDGTIAPSPTEPTQQQINEVQNFNCSVPELISRNPGKEILLVHTRYTNQFNATGIILG